MYMKPHLRPLMDVPIRVSLLLHTSNTIFFYCDPGRHTAVAVAADLERWSVALLDV
jgi:hypothetical protein